MRSGPTDEELSALETHLRLEFKDRNLVRQAFVHKSYLNEIPEGSPKVKSYDRLEFLGDALIGLAVANHYYKFRDEQEGGLTELRKAKVEETSEAEAAVRLGLGDYIAFGRGAERDGHDNQRLLADCFEALMGAIFLDLGFEMPLRRWSGS